MTREEKQLLLKDLCARLTYGLKVQIDFGEHCAKYGIDRYADDTVICVWPETFEVGVNDEDQACYIEDIKPYLRTFDSMTDEEKENLFQLMGNGTDIERVDFYISHHLNYRGLISMGLALEAPEGMYN